MIIPMSTETAAVSVSDLRKVYGENVAVDGVSFSVAPGEIFGLLGPNGAGKTSILETLEGLRLPDGGSASILGIDPFRDIARLRHIIGVQLQTSSLPESMCVVEAMRFFSAYHGVPPHEDLLVRLGLKDKLRAQYRTLSTGLQRRLVLALALAHRPPVVFLDEPTAGLDVASRVELHNLILEIKAGGATVILATHDMAEAEKLADRVAILLRGHLVAQGTPKELTAAGSGLTKISVRTENESLAGASFPAVSQRLEKEDYAVFYSSDPGTTVAAIIAHVETRSDTLIDLRVERPSLEERFLEITGGEAVK